MPPPGMGFYRSKQVMHHAVAFRKQMRLLVTMSVSRNFNNLKNSFISAKQNVIRETLNVSIGLHNFLHFYYSSRNAIIIIT